MPLGVRGIMMMGQSALLHRISSAILASDPLGVLFRLLLLLIHLVVSIHERVSRIVRSYLQAEPTPDQLVLMTQRLQRIPSCVAFVCSSRDVQDPSSKELDKLLHLIRACISLGIKHVCLFDDVGFLEEWLPFFEKRLHLTPVEGRWSLVASNGNLKSSRSLFDDNDNSQLEEELHLGNGCAVGDHLPLSRRLLAPSSDSWGSLFHAGLLEDWSTGPSSLLCFLSERDARRHVCKVARDFVRHQRETSFTLDQGDHQLLDRSAAVERSWSNATKSTAAASSAGGISLKMMEKAMEVEQGIPDPDLVVRLSPTPSLFGFCPWQVRLSEIIPLPVCNAGSSGSVFYAFLCVLRRFDLCESRFGK